MKFNSFYYNLFKGTIKKTIASHYGKEYAHEIMKKSKVVHKEIVLNAPDIGDNNPMGYNVLFALAFFAPYIASEKHISKEVITEAMKNSLYHVKWFFRITNLNTKKGKLSNSKSVRKYYDWYTKEKEEKYPNSFKVDFVGKPSEDACYYRITKCPICNYAKTLGVSELMPLFCDLDNVMIHLQHGNLHRKYTIAKGDEYCDYYITGDKEDL